MEQLIRYLLGTIESSYQDLAHLVPCGSFLGLFDERPIKRTHLSDSVPAGSATPSPLFEFDNNETTCNAVTSLTLNAINSGAVPAVEVLRMVVDAVRNIHDASAVLDVAFRSLFEIYQKRLEYHRANRYNAVVVAGRSVSDSTISGTNGKNSSMQNTSQDALDAAREENNGLLLRKTSSTANAKVETFGEEYLILTNLFELHRPRTWVAAVRLMSMVTKSAIKIMYGGTIPGEPSSLSAGTHAASLSEISGLNLLPEHVCRETIRQVWRLLLDSAAIEPPMSSVLSSARRTRWQIRFEATMELFDCFVGRSEQCLGRPLVSYYLVSRELDPGAAVAESGILTSEMQYIVDLCFGRKRRLGRILLPPDGSWPLISHASRAHTVKHVYDQPAYALVRDSLTFEETERGPSANKYVADLLYQRAPTDEIFAAIRNHRIMKKKAIAAVANDSYVPNNSSIEYGGDGLFSQRPSVDMSAQGGVAYNKEMSDNAEAEKYEVSQLLLESMTQRIEHIVRYIQSQCDFETLLNERKLNENSDPTMIIPRNIQYWEYMNEAADQLYYFVLFDAISYKDVHERFYSMVFPKDSDIHPGSETRKDNSYIWLLLQLFHIEKVSAGPLREDLAGDEDMLDQLLQMYNEQQIVSKDAFYLRDLALQATMTHQQSHIRDNQGFKYRHPRMAVAMPFAPVVYQLQQEFGRQFKDENYGLLEGSNLCSVMKTATVSQLRQFVVPNALYTYLVPPKEVVLKLQNDSTTYLQGGNIGHRLLDYINVGGKHRLLQLMYKMMLAHELGPQFQFDGKQPSVREGITCVSPHIMDTVYRLLYNAPYSNELMMKEVLEKLRRCDKVMAMGNARFSPATLRWLYTVYQLMNCRLLRFFKYYAHASHLVHHLRHSLVHASHRQLYSSLECFALCLVNLQHDVGFLQALMNPAYHGVPLTPHPSAMSTIVSRNIKYTKPKDAWFECAMLSRNAVMVISRIATMRGLGDVIGLSLEDCIDSLSPLPQYWAPSVLRYLPRAVRSYYAKSARAPKGPQPSASAAAILQLIESRPVHNALLLTQPNPQAEAGLLSFYAEVKRQPLFLFVLWVLLERLTAADTGAKDNGSDSYNGPVLPAMMLVVVRRVLLSFPLSQISTYTSSLIDFIIGCELERGSKEPSATTKQLLDDFIFKYYFIHHEHVVFALTRGEHDMRTDNMRLALTRFVLLESPSFTERLNEWHRLDFQGRYWADYNHWTKQETYLAKFPEYFEYEGYLVQHSVPLDPPPALSLPIYYENRMVRLLPVLEFALGRLIEAEDRVLLRDVLDRMGILYRLHQVPLTTLMNTLFVYYNAPTLHDASVMRSLNLSLLDMSQQNFSPEFEQFVHGEVGDEKHIDDKYLRRMMVRITRAITRHLGRPEKNNLPEIHYREIPNPILLSLTECVVELLTWWCLYNAPRSSERLYDPATDRVPAPSTEPEFRAEEETRQQQAGEWPLGRLWLDIVMKPAKRPEGGMGSGASFIHSTGVLANVLPDELMAFPYVRYLADVVLQEPMLKTISGPKRYFSFVEFSQTSASSRKHQQQAASTQFAATAVFNSFEQNRNHRMANRPNTYLTLLHSILHYGGIGTFNALGETIRALAASGELCSDIQLLYLCATVGPILYRLVDYESLYVQILGDLVLVMAQVCPQVKTLDTYTSTDALEQVMDFFCFVKDQFDPGHAAWRRIAPHISALPSLLRYQLQCIVDQ
ncbi:hypothetical protein GGI25_001379 [Coemansia spiralis]|uniref:Mediator of RNA polymerase II transcription subunit 23 n=2 Tax=Coemansia TaxID=4863 RepID=A0A9W8KZL9_9FUNG|nr:mediator complex subunit 23-domain-containing protein [Coemansia spiralis]KAJ1995152.1 hypothetical protein EDC05_001243 [Coemansia umbellata]KAJ2624081.1 hypothetical protein GGI26_001874 [Coemansia sp. RSA 1358]KAJ2679689.1 hypothetical protein GGI25_001379 [Coemansia spiralis]